MPNYFTTFKHVRHSNRWRREVGVFAARLWLGWYGLVWCVEGDVLMKRIG
ncbi:hypothetical protein M3J09_008552 [Ascochyta lentis]